VSNQPTKQPDHELAQACIECGKPSFHAFCSDACEQRFLDSAVPAARAPLGTTPQPEAWDGARLTNHRNRR
jgi:hypothetical protein